MMFTTEATHRHRRSRSEDFLINIPSESRYTTNPTEIAEVKVPDFQATTVNTYLDKSAFDAFEEIRNNMGTRLQEEIKR